MIKFILKILGLIVGLFYISTVVCAYISPNFMSFSSSYTLFFPLALLLVCIVFIVSCFFYWRVAIVLALIALVGYKNIHALIALNFSNRYLVVQKTEKTIRILQWNVSTFLDFREKQEHKKRMSAEKERIAVLKYINADILCLQEVFISDKYNIVQQIANILKYKYTFIPTNNLAHHTIYYGSVILSKYPILSKRIYPFSIGSPFDNILNATIETPNGTFAVYTTHLQSNKLNDDEKQILNEITVTPEKIISEEKYKFLKKINQQSKIRTQQIEELVQHLTTSDDPYLLCLDMNEIPSSYNYFLFNKNLFKDAFLESGFGIGHTYRYITPFLRLDYVFTAPTLKTLKTIIFDTHLSDHYPIIVDVRNEAL